MTTPRSRLLRSIVAAGLASLACAPALLARQGADAPASAPAPANAAERWKGAIALPGGQSLDFEVVFTPGADGGPASGATVSIPAQGLKDGVCNGVTYTASAIAFTLPLPSPEATWPSFAATRDGADPAKAAGTMKQAGMEFPFTLERLRDGETVGPKRPQEPNSPFPYTSREVFALNSADGTKLAGTLTIPEAGAFGPGPHPVALLITGSGQQDRDETLLGHKPFLVLADHLTRAGVAVLRVDDRGVGGSTSGKPLERCTTDDFVGDALACVEALKAQPGVDPKRIGLIGHSEGGLIAPMVAARSADVAFVVLLAGPGVNGREILMEQIPAGAKASGATEELVATIRERTGALLDAVAGGDEDAIRAGARALVEADPDTAKADATMLDQTAQMLAKQFSSDWFRRFLTLDPCEALRKTKVPVLALNGSLDVQVLAWQNLPPLRAALKEAGNEDVTIEELPGLNHLFQTATTGGGQEYAMIEETFSPVALEKVSAWVRAKTGLAK